MPWTISKNNYLNAYIKLLFSVMIYSTILFFASPLLYFSLNPQLFVGFLAVITSIEAFNLAQISIFCWTFILLFFLNPVIYEVCKEEFWQAQSHSLFFFFLFLFISLHHYISMLFLSSTKLLDFVVKIWLSLWSLIFFAMDHIKE